MGDTIGRKKMKGRSLLVMLIALTILIQLVSAANVGVSPANINFKNVLRSGYAERPITVTIDSELATEIEIETYGNTSDWINFSSESLSVSKGNPLQIIVSANPPSDVPNGNYEGFLRIKSSKLGSGQEGHATGIVIPTLDVHVVTQITDQEILDCQASSFKISNAEKGDDVILTMNIENRGNIKISPKAVLDIWDQSSTNLVSQKEFYPSEITPTKQNQFIFKVSSLDLDIGQYWVDISVPDCYSSQTLTFDILEEGALYAAGTLQKIITEPWADVNEIVSILASFQNTGEKSLEARFVGKIMHQNKIIQLIESDESLFIPINSQDNFQFYFTPKKAGKYIISGRVFYDNKRTYEQSAILNIRPEGSIAHLLKTFSYAMLVIIISVLLFKIRRERRSYFNLKSRR